MKAMLASNYDESKLVFPLGAQPKIDGVRSHTPDGVLLGRSNKQHKNRYTSAFFSVPEYAYLDGEMAAEHECNPALCRLTSSALSTIGGNPFILWHVFDLLTPDVIGRPYIHRHSMLRMHVESLQHQGLAGHLRVVPMMICNNLEELLYWDSVWLEQGYEGTIIRSLNGKHKQGRSTVREGGLLRIKRFLDFEFEVLSVEEGERNGNPEQTNELGNTFRSSHQENMMPNGCIGSMQGRVLNDVIDPSSNAVVLRKDQIVTVGAGEMPHDLRKFWFENPTQFVRQISKGQFFPKGILNKPRFPTWTSLRSKEDLD